jgi:RES domain-containing protein
LVHSEDTRVLAAIRWVAIPVRIEDTLIEIPHSLPADWRRLPAPPSTRELGSRWVAEARSVVLRVPSAVVDGEFNYLLNPRHPDFARLEFAAPRPFSFDSRLSQSKRPA